MPASDEHMSQFSTLVDIIARLRSREGCPWDRKQTHKSLQKHLLEECYEVLDAIDREDASQLCEELGDLLLQIVIHAQISGETKEFEIGDVIKSLVTKLIHRHPHVFGEEKVRDVTEVVLNWEELKRKERKVDTSMLSGVPENMPALAYSQNIQQRVAQVGFDWENIDGVIEKLIEEVNEFRQADSQQRKEQEFGDLLFTLANISRHLGIDAELALRGANQRFYRRFAHMEQTCRQRGLTLSQLSFKMQNALWEEVKQAEDSA